jgi:hypothetical protein
MKANFKKALFTKLAALGIGMFLLGSANTWAADMCFTEDTTSATYVGKNFSFPAAGTCKAFDGFGVGGGCVFTGTACGTSNNADIRFNLNYSCNAPNAFGIHGVRSFDLSRVYPGMDKANLGYYCQPNGVSDATWSCRDFHVKTIPCASPVPIN